MRHLFAALALVVAVSHAPSVAVAGASARGAAGACHVVLASAQPLGQVLKSIERRIPGRALDARKIERDGRTIYSVKWLGNDGKVRVITVDASSGEIEQIR
ncbi:MAG TPA: PepSY domain-containing protein [Kofleriaceae bacterium]|nr:PepSY domain-containing protein [Kofleriaceae bacterium]